MTAFAAFPPVRTRTPMSAMGILRSPQLHCEDGWSTSHIGRQPDRLPLLHRSSLVLGEIWTRQARAPTGDKMLNPDISSTLDNDRGMLKPVLSAT